MSFDPFVALCQAHGLPIPQPEFRFHPVRRWRFDYAWPASLIAVEVEGGAWTRGRHTRGKGFIADLEKYNEAQVLGWVVLRYTPDQLAKGSCFTTLTNLLQPSAPEVSTARSSMIPRRISTSV